MSRAGRHGGAARSRARVVRLSREARAIRRRDRSGPIAEGIGFAAFMHGAGFTGSGEDHLASIVEVEALPDGRVRVLTANTEIGQGTNTIFSQIAADALGIAVDDDRRRAARHVASFRTADRPSPRGPAWSSASWSRRRRIGLRRTLVDCRSAAARPTPRRSSSRPAALTSRAVGPLKASAQYRPPAGTAMGRRAVSGGRVRHLRVGRLRRGGHAWTRRRSRRASTTSSPSRKSAR